MGYTIKYDIAVDSPLLASQTITLHARTDLNGSDLISLAAAELNIANDIIISMHYEHKGKAQLIRSEDLRSQSPYRKARKIQRHLNMRLTTSADAEGFYTIHPPGQFVCPQENSPLSPVQIALDNDIGKIAKNYDTPAMSAREPWPVL